MSNNIFLQKYEGLKNRVFACRVAMEEANEERIQSVSECWTMCMVHSGVLEYEVDGVHHKATERHLIVTYPDQAMTVERYSADLSASILSVPHEVMYAAMRYDISKKRFPNISSGMNQPIVEQNVVLDHTTCHELHLLFSILLPRVAPQTDKENRAVAVPLIEAMTLLMIEATQSHESLLLPKSHNEVISSNFMELLQQNFREHHEVSFYSAQAGLTVKYFSAIVKQTTNATPQEWIARSLYYEACQLLRNTDKPVSDIAFDLNFSSSSSFVRFFRNREGVPPGAFRHGKEETNN